MSGHAGPAADDLLDRASEGQTVHHQPTSNCGRIRTEAFPLRPDLAGVSTGERSRRAAHVPAGRLTAAAIAEAGRRWSTY